MIDDGSSEQGLPIPPMVAVGSYEDGTPVIKTIEIGTKTDPISQAIKDANKAIEDSKKPPTNPPTSFDQQEEAYRLQEVARKEAEAKRLADLNAKLVEITGREDLKALLKQLGEATGSDRLTLLYRAFPETGKYLPLLQIDSNGSVYALNAPGDLTNSVPLVEFKRVDVSQTPNDERGVPYLTDSMKKEQPFLADATSFYSKRGGMNYEAVTWEIGEFGNNKPFQQLKAEHIDSLVENGVINITRTLAPQNSTPVPGIPK